MFLPLDGFNQCDRHKALAVESGLSSGRLLLILALSRLRSYFIECIISYQLQTPESPAEKKVGRAAFDSGEFDCALKKTPSNTHHMLPSKGRLSSWSLLYGLRLQHDMNDVEGKSIWMIRWG